MRSKFILSSVLALCATAAIAQSDVIAERQQLMKRNGAAMREVVPMVRGETPFDAAAALTALEMLATDAADLDPDGLFPEGTETGDDTEAAPRIWEDRTGFVAAVEKFKTDTAAAVEAKPATVEALGAALNQVGQNCGGCHELYRIDKG